MRRKDRERDRDFALSVVDGCSYAVLATVNEDNTPYCIPVSIVRDGESLYFHCAREGQKTENMRRRPDVCLTCVGQMSLPKGKFTVGYDSAVVYGLAEEVSDEEERIRAMRLLCSRYVPGDMADFDSYMQKNGARAAVWKISIDRITGKQNPLRD